ncbi:MAG: tripartite tricarboxylate transporter permease [Lachnospiraceae bacterium]|nr:tripartite tricarboxylate transporter permease [Lachnospiraceae bacterium]
MNLLQNLGLGFSILADPMVIVYSLVGVVSGVIIGALPGLGPSVGIAVLLPLCYGLSPACALCMLCGIYYGAMYGGSITAILINTPGDSAAIMTTLDGYPLARQGKAGKALGMACLASVIGGTVSVVLFMSLAPIISNFATSFGPSEYFALMVLGLTSVAGMTGKSPAKGFLAAFLGLFVAGIGIDLVFGTPKFVFGNVNLYSGIDFVPVAMGLFGIAEIICNFEDNNIQVDKESLKLKKLLPNKEEWKRTLPHIGRGTILGFIVGMLPGAGATIASFLSYDMAKRTSKHKNEFGKGAVEGVAAPECANNAASMGAMVPMLTLGVPGSGATAIMMGALMMLGISPGPSFFVKNAEVAWGLVASMYLGNVILVLLGLGALRLFVKILNVKTTTMNALIFAFILIGAYALENSMFTVGVTLFFGILGYFLKKLKVPAAPMVLALVLGAITETNLRQALIIDNNNFFKVLTHPISAVILVIALLLAFGTPIKNLFAKVKAKGKKKE